MKTRYTIVIGLQGGDESEVIDSMVGLFLGKIHDEGGPIYVSIAGFPSSSNWRSYIATEHSLDKRDIQSIEGGDVGVYIVSHGSGNNVGGLSAAHLAALIQELGFTAIRKLCLVACNTGNSLKSAAEEGVQTDINQSYIGSLCRALYPMTPMIAGYAGFVTVAHPKYPGRIGVPTSSGGWQWKRDHGSAAAGKKLTKKAHKQGRVTVMTPEARSSIKVIAQSLDGHTVNLVGLDQWHDD